MKKQKEFYSLVEKLSNKYSPNTQLHAGKSHISIENTQVFKLRESIQQNSDFLKNINMFTVFDSIGDKLSCVSKNITGRQENSRNVAQVEHDNQRYELIETDSGVLIPWHLLDHFALYQKEQEARYEKYIQTQIALDMLQIGWYGNSIASSTTKDDLSDVNKGWLTLLAEQRSKGFMTEGSQKTGAIKIFGENADFVNLDQLALELKQALDRRHQCRNDLVFLVGSELVAKEKTPIYQHIGNNGQDVLSAHYLTNNFGGMPAIIPPNFPEKCAVVTTLKNLSIYDLADSQRISIRQDDDNKAIIHSYLRHEAYVIEDLSLMAAIDHTKVTLG
ncbi:phage major capsid protein, P2 family [Pasteurella multocida]